ncbi:molecular chaperone Hsp33 [Rhizomicrobium palustre]|uniref:Molecular chaperone Hsp33 n=1 Tax=Rhizomicrobium palustre TaxID=189966 RepID=A0A846N012_9PROT|nr:Hsp33 family molecular chaperone HslO [Rhizomicrobium palustre]NIK89026.1 molecular chaperone Hsp33 [Rhizomicrobium palustre]
MENYINAPAGDFVLPFDVVGAGIRGRLVRLDATSARALSVHALPEAAARVAGEVLALSVLLGTALKLDGRLTAQTKSDGPLDLVAADYYGATEDKPKGVRAYARYDANAELGEKPLFAALAGEGSLAITIEPLRGGQTYQGIVPLSPKGIAVSAETYFEQSEQLPTLIRLAAAPVFHAGAKEPTWRVGGLMLQATPGVARGEDDWDRLAALAGSVEDVELLDTALSAETLLWRLFNQEEVRVQPAEEIAFRCDCSGERIAAVLQSYTEEERSGLADPDGVIRAKCEFCGTVHEIGKATVS